MPKRQEPHSALTILMRSARRYPLLEDAEIRSLIAKAQSGDIGAKQKIARHNIRLIVKIAERYSKYASLEELVGVGTIGLYRAIEKFNLDKNFKFSTYAYQWIRQGMTRSCLRDRTIRVPDNVIGEVFQIKTAVRRLGEQGKNSPNKVEIAAAMGKSEEWVADRANFSHPTLSLDVQINLPNSKETHQDMIKDVQFILPEEYAETIEGIDRLHHILERISEPSRELLIMRYGLIDGEYKTEGVLAEKFQVSRSTINVRLKQAIKEARRAEGLHYA